MKNPIKLIAGTILAIAAISSHHALANFAQVGINIIGYQRSGAESFNVISGDVAGAPGFAQANWNEIAGGGATDSITGTITDVVDSNGVPTTIDMSWEVNNTWVHGGSAPTPTDGSGALMWGFLDNADEQPFTLSVSEIPFPTYSVVVYFDGDNNGEDRVLQYDLSTSTGHNDLIFARDAIGVHFNNTGVFTQVPSTSKTNLEASTPAGNYVVFEGVSGDSFDLTSTPLFDTYNNLRSPINGIQIVQVPEPATVGLLFGLAFLGLAVWRKRN